jgi:hypothetical protein
MEETRSHLEEKLEALENQVSDTVQTTTAAVAETVDNVKETVEKASETVGTVTEAVKETVESVGDTFNLWKQAERRPWLVFGGSVLVGFLGAQLVGRSDGEREEEEEAPSPAPRSWSAPQENPAPPPRHAEQPEPEEKSWFWDELGRFKGLAVGALMGVLRDLSKRVVPEPIGNRVAEEMDHLTTQLGGEPIHGSVLPGNTTQSV